MCVCVCVCVCVLAYYHNFYFILHNVTVIELGPLLSHILHRVCPPNSSYSSQDRTFYFYFTAYFFSDCTCIYMYTH